LFLLLLSDFLKKSPKALSMSTSAGTIDDTEKIFRRCLKTESGGTEVMLGDSSFHGAGDKKSLFAGCSERE